MEPWPTTGHCVGQCRKRPPLPLHRHTAGNAESTDGPQLLGRRVPGPRHSTIVADTSVIKIRRHLSEAETLPHDLLTHRFHGPSRVRALRAS